MPQTLPAPAANMRDVEMELVRSVARFDQAIGEKLRRAMSDLWSHVTVVSAAPTTAEILTKLLEDEGERIADEAVALLITGIKEKIGLPPKSPSTPPFVSDQKSEVSPGASSV